MTLDPRDPPNAPPDAPPRRAGQTQPVKDAVPSSPQQPHERDESSRSQQGGPNEVMQKAHDDVERGVADTSRAEATDATYSRNLRDADHPPVCPEGKGGTAPGGPADGRSPGSGKR